MSHVDTILLKIHDLDALAAAAEEVGCELVRGQQTYNWYGTHVGDYPLPQGFTRAELGKCEHAIRVKGADSRTYEVGVVRAKDGKGYVLLYDFWQGGYGLLDKIGERADHLKQQYAAKVARKTLRQKGYDIQQVKRADGKIVLKAVK